MNQSDHHNSKPSPKTPTHRTPHNTNKNHNRESEESEEEVAAKNKSNASPDDPFKIGILIAGICIIGAGVVTGGLGSIIAAIAIIAIGMLSLYMLDRANNKKKNTVNSSPAQKTTETNDEEELIDDETKQKTNDEEKTAGKKEENNSWLARNSGKAAIFLAGICGLVSTAMLLFFVGLPVLGAVLLIGFAIVTAVAIIKKFESQIVDAVKAIGKKVFGIGGKKSPAEEIDNDINKNQFPDKITTNSPNEETNNNFSTNNNSSLESSQNDSEMQIETTDQQSTLEDLSHSFKRRHLENYSKGDNNNFQEGRGDIQMVKMVPKPPSPGADDTQTIKMDHK